MTKLYQSIWVPHQHRAQLRELLIQLKLDPVFVTASGHNVVLASARVFTFIGLQIGGVSIRDLDSYEQYRLDYYQRRRARRARVWPAI